MLNDGGSYRIALRRKPSTALGTSPMFFVNAISEYNGPIECRLVELAISTTPVVADAPVVDLMAFGARARAPGRPSPVRHAGSSDRPNCGSHEQDSGPRSQKVHVSRAYVAHMQRGDLARPEGNQGLTQMLRFRGTGALLEP